MVDFDPIFGPSIHLHTQAPRLLSAYPKSTYKEYVAAYVGVLGDQNFFSYIRRSKQPPKIPTIIPPNNLFVFFGRPPAQLTPIIPPNNLFVFFGRPPAQLTPSTPPNNLFVLFNVLYTSKQPHDTPKFYPISYLILILIMEQKKATTKQPPSNHKQPPTIKKNKLIFLAP